MNDRLPLSVISGYLGAGKTTLINRVLAEKHGQRLFVLVNDFGAICIDECLLESATEDTLVLANGCVCCTMGADLFLAVGDILDRADRPDHLLIEASGIADPSRIAQVAKAEPQLAYGGITTVVDAQLLPKQLQDLRIGKQVRQQIAAADLVCISKATSSDPASEPLLDAQACAPIVNLAKVDQISPALLGLRPSNIPARYLTGHNSYISWQYSGKIKLCRAALLAKLKQRPDDILRLKGFVSNDDETAWQVQCVGPTTSIKPVGQPLATTLVAIGLSDRITEDEIERWWRR
ncbi:CobW family GTP-binding protein [Hoeflea sp. CAU 1731]